MKKTLSVFLSAFMILTFVYVLFSAQVHADEEIKVGSTVLFGSYEQDNDTSNGSEAIKWRVLSIDEENGTALLLSTYILDVGQFNEKSGTVYWENSYMRDWLNSYFLQTAFSEEESSSLILSKVKAENNPKYPDIANGSDTEDHVFLLSYNEAVSLLHYAEVGYMDLYKYDGEEAYINTDMISFYTPYAEAKGGYTQEFLKTGFWWCRTMGIDNGNVCNVANTGYASTYGHFITMKTYGIRPAVNVKLDALTLTDDEVMPYYGKDREEPEPVSEESSDEVSEEPSVEESEEESSEISEEISEEVSEEISEEVSEEQSSEESSTQEESVPEASEEVSENGQPEVSEEDDVSVQTSNGENSDEIFSYTEPVPNKMRFLGVIIIVLIVILTVVFVKRIAKSNSGTRYE